MLSDFIVGPSPWAHFANEERPQDPLSHPRRGESGRGVSEAFLNWFARRRNFVSVELGCTRPKLRRCHGQDNCHGHDRTFLRIWIALRLEDTRTCRRCSNGLRMQGGNQVGEAYDAAYDVGVLRISKMPDGHG